MQTMSQITAIIPAGGVGERAKASWNGMAIPKQYRLIKDKAMLLHTVDALLAHPMMTSVVIGVADKDDWIETLSLPPQCIVSRTGGATRADTVLNTLIASGLDDNAWVMVHDGARPGLPFANLDALIQQCIQADSGGILALPVSDTVKRQQSHQTLPVIERTIDRQGLWLAQTPQLFKKAQLENALQQALQAGFVVTDEASAIEFVGESCLLVKGHWKNLKVTWPEDFELVEYFL